MLQVLEETYTNAKTFKPYDIWIVDYLSVSFYNIAMISEHNFKMTERKGEFLVGLALALRGSSLLFAKIAMNTMGPFLLMGMRFLIAFIVIGLIFNKQLRKVTLRELINCVLIGFFFFLSMAFELRGLQTTSASVTSFLEGGVVIVVPIITCITYRRLPDKITVVSAIIALCGVGFLTLKGGHIGFSVGELFVLGGTFWYSVTVPLTDRAAKTGDPLVIAVYQLLFISLFAFAGAFVWEDIRMPHNQTEWIAILCLALICSGLGFTLQPIGQKYTTADRAGLLAVFNPLSASTLGIIFLHERLTVSIVIGAILIIISIIAPAAANIYKGKSQA